MDSNSQPPAPPAATMDSNSVLQGSLSQQTAAVAAQAAPTDRSTAQTGTAVPRSPTAVGVLAFRRVLQHPRPKIPVFRPAAPAATVATANLLPPRTVQVAEQQHLQDSSSQMVAASMLGVGRPLAPAMAVTLANNPSPRFMQVDNRLTLRDLQGSKLPVFRGPPPRPELVAGSGSGNALLQSLSLSDTGPCALNKQAGLPSPDSSSEWDSGSEDGLEMLDSGSDNEKL